MKNKKCFGLLGLAGATLLLTGCGGNKLTCTMSEEMEGLMKADAEVTISFDKDWKKITEVSADQTVEILVEDVTDEDIDELADEAKAECDDFGEDASKCDVKKNGKKVTLSVKGKPSVYDLEEEMTKEEVIEALEDEGYTCK